MWCWELAGIQIKLKVWFGGVVWQTEYMGTSTDRDISSSEGFEAFSHDCKPSFCPIYWQSFPKWSNPPKFTRLGRPRYHNVMVVCFWNDLSLELGMIGIRLWQEGRSERSEKPQNHQKSKIPRPVDISRHSVYRTTLPSQISSLIWICASSQRRFTALQKKICYIKQWW